jgi:hypothetical protein
MQLKTFFYKRYLRCPDIWLLACSFRNRENDKASSTGSKPGTFSHLMIALAEYLLLCPVLQGRDKWGPWKSRNQKLALKGLMV